MSVYKFGCGCEIPIINEDKKDCDDLPSLRIPYNDIQIALNYGNVCDETWDLLSSGKTKGIFQLETELGQSWSSRLKPTSMEEIAALISLIRPGCLRAIVDGKSMTQHYVDRKSGVEPTEFFHKQLAPILSKTYGVLTYQEQAMRIATVIAGFNEQEADILRKAIGKKKPEIMAQVKKTFIDGCRKVGLVTEEEAEEIFSWIQESQKYSFNKSHGIGYGEIGFLTAYVKKHFPLQFFCSWMKFARHKQDPQEEIKLLVSDAKQFDIEIRPPSIKTIRENNCDMCVSDNHVNFGIRCIKKIGESVITKMLAEINNLEEELGKPIHEWSWYEFLVCLGDKISSTAFNGLISVGALSHYSYSRQSMLYDYEHYRKLTKLERKSLRDYKDSTPTISDGLDRLISYDKSDGGASTVTRKRKIQDIKQLLDNPPHSIQDSPKWIIAQEKQLLGTALTFTPIQAVDCFIVTNTTCREYNDGKTLKNMSMRGEITKCREWTIKNGKNVGSKMAFINLEDDTGTTECVVFTDSWLEYEADLYEGCTVIVKGSRSDKGSFIINEVFPI